jgi:hypothetical protein
MYAKHGVHLFERGWPAVIPLIPGEKRPAISGWQKYNTSVVSREQAEHWARHFPNHGIGHAAGHGLIGIDLDTDQEKQAATAKAIADRHLGPTPMIRIGLPPRVMRYYQRIDCASGCVTTSSFPLFGIYATTGQTAWFGIHPTTGKPYNWNEASPLDMGPSDLPTVADINLHSFVDEMTTAFPASPSNGECTRPTPRISNLASGGVTTSIMREMGLSPYTSPIEIALKWISSAAVGTRHSTMVGAVTALVNAGLGDQDIFDAVADAHVESLSGDRPAAQTRRVVRNAITWVRDRIGASLDRLDEDLHVDDWSIWP